MEKRRTRMRRIIIVLLALLLCAGMVAAQETVYGVAAGIPKGKAAKDYKFAFCFGGVNPYADPVPGACNDVGKKLGIPTVIEQTPKNWEQNEQNTILDALVAKGIRGILMMPSNAVAANVQITKMVKAGIPVVCMGGPPKEPSSAVLTLATDVYQSSFMGTTEVIKAIGEKGNIVALSGQVSDPNTVMRFQAAKDACAKYPNVTLMQTIGDIDDAEASMTAVENLLSARGDEVNGIISTAYFPSVAVATFLKNPKYAHIKAVGIDTDQKVLDAIRAGVLLGTMSQNPYGQGYIGTLTLKMLKDGWTYKKGQPFLVDSGSFFISKDNIDRFDDIKMEVTNKLLESWASRFNPPRK
jgi:ribose transport system substrate-binding protein